MEAETRKIRMGKTKRRREEMRGEEVEEGRGKEKKNPKKEKTMEVKRIAQEWETWNEEEVAAKLEEKAKMLVSERFYK